MARVRLSTERSFKRAAKRIRSYARDMEKETPKALRGIGEEIMADVKASRPGKGVPVDTGALRSSGKVDGPDTQNVVTLSFGGAAAPYAVVQHERLDYSHETGEARYLVRGVERWEPNASAAIAALKANAEAGIRKASGGA